ncbi:hypothetical protein Tco_0854857 [Tanacetum coccineum]
MAVVNKLPQLVDKKGGSYAAIASKLEPVKFNSFKGPSDTKENKIMDLKLEYQTFKAKPTESLSQTYTRYKTLLNELTNDGINISKHEINVGYSEQTPRDRADSLRKVFPMKDIPKPKKDFQENSDDDVDERSSEEYLRDLDIEFHEKALLSEPSYKTPVTGYSLVSKGFQPKFTPKLIQSSQNSISQADPKIQKDYKAEYKKIKAKLALLKQIHLLLRTQRPSNQRTNVWLLKPLIWHEKEVSNDEEVTQVKVLMALVDDEFTVGNNNARNGEWIDITMRKVNILLSMDKDVD